MHKHIVFTKTSYKLVLVALVFGVIGLFTSVLSLASPISYVFEAESGTLVGTVKLTSDTNASAGRAIVFGVLDDIDVSWNEVVATKNINSITDWYKNNTGYESCGLSSSDLIPYTGSREITVDGTIIENAKIPGNIRIRAKNVTIRCSEVDVKGGYSYGVDINSTAVNFLVEQVSVINSTYDVTQNYEDRGNRVVHATSIGASGTIRQIKNLDGFSSGLSAVGVENQVWEYNYVDHIVRSPDSHNTSFTLRSQATPVKNITIYRNLLLDGTSSAFSFYSRNTGLQENILIKQNIFDLPHTTSTNYCAHYDSEHPSYGPYTMKNVLYEGNIFGQTMTLKCGTSGRKAGGCDSIQSGPGYCEIKNDRYISE